MYTPGENEKRSDRGWRDWSIVILQLSQRTLSDEVADLMERKLCGHHWELHAKVGTVFIRLGTESSGWSRGDKLQWGEESDRQKRAGVDHIGSHRPLTLTGLFLRFLSWVRWEAPLYWDGGESGRRHSRGSREPLRPACDTLGLKGLSDIPKETVRRWLGREI